MFIIRYVLNYQIKIILLISFFITNSFAQNIIKDRSINIYEENDFFALENKTDIHYTQGLRIEYMKNLPDRVKMLCFIPIPGYHSDFTEYHFASGFIIGHNVYTPQDITATETNPKDRPYGAWLYASHQIKIIDDFTEWQDTYEISFGLLGPKALGDEIQSGFHKIIDDDNPTWVNQIEPEFPIAVYGSFDRKWIFQFPVGAYYFNDKSFKAFIIPVFRTRVGNVFTDFGTGATITFGWNTPQNFDVGLINPSIKPEEAPKNIRVYFSLQSSGRYVAYNVFLDEKFGSGYRIKRNKLINDFIAGFHFDICRLSLNYLQVYRSPEIKSGTGYHTFGAVQLNYNF